MGINKASLRLGRRTLLNIVRANAVELRRPVRVLRRDLLARCGPLGGIYSTLATTVYPAVLFLACDMPFVSPALLHSLIGKFDGKRSLFSASSHGTGFPFILPTSTLPIVDRLIAEQTFSVHQLASATNARLVRVPARTVFNINTPEDLIIARKRASSAQEQLVKRR